MDRWIVVIIVLLLGGSTYFLLQPSKQPKQIAIVKKAPLVQTKKTEKKDIQILYLDDDSGKKNTTSKAQQMSKTTQDSSSVAQTQEQITNHKSQDFAPKYAEKQEEIRSIIVENGLQKITPKGENDAHPKFSIYAKNSLDQIDEQKYENKPPMVPTIITVTTPKGEKYSVVANTKIVQNNDKIYIAKNTPDGEPQSIIEVPTKQDSNPTEKTQETQDKQKQESIKLMMPPSF